MGGTPRPKIAPLALCDLDRASQLMMAAFRLHVAPGLGPEGLATFTEVVSPVNLRKEFEEGQVMRGAFIRTRLVGVAALRGTHHLKLMFVDPKYQGRGIGKLLMLNVLNVWLLRDEKVEPLTVAATDYAIPFYEKQGFKQTGPREEKHGLIYTPMAYWLEYLEPTEQISLDSGETDLP